MKSINQMVLLSTILALSVGLMSSPISLQLVSAEKPSICFGNHFCPNMVCTNNPLSLTADCCWSTMDGTVCQTCDVNTDTGEFEDCGPVHTPVVPKGIPDSSPVIPPPSGKAPPPSTEKCPDNSAVDKNGNCTPMTQLPDDTSDNNKPNLRGNLLNDMMVGQSQDSSTFEEQENESDG